MFSQITLDETRSIFGFRRYLLIVTVHVTQPDLDIIRSHRLDRGEIYFDPVRDTLRAAAEAAHAEAQSYGLFVTSAREARSIAGAELRALHAAWRSRRAFTISVADLLRGVTIKHWSLTHITRLQHILTDCLDDIEMSVTNARRYSERTREIFEPEADRNRPRMRPGQWTHHRRR